MAEAERWQLNDFALRCFRYTADHDYVSARLAFRARTYGTFQWLGLHALEKYLKCILLLHRVKATNVRHSLGKAVAKLAEVERPTIEFSDEVRATMAYFDQVGPYRYLEVSHHLDGRKLTELDRAVWEVRRYCRVFLFDVHLTEGMSWGELAEAEIEQAAEAPHAYRIQSGELERILDGEDSFQRRALIWYNSYFGTRSRKRVTFRFTRYENAPLFNYPDLVDEAAKYVFIPKHLIEGYRTLAKGELPGS